MTDERARVRTPSSYVEDERMMAHLAQERQMEKEAMGRAVGLPIRATFLKSGMSCVAKYWAS